MGKYKIVITHTGNYVTTNADTGTTKRLRWTRLLSRPWKTTHNGMLATTASKMRQPQTCRQRVARRLGCCQILLHPWFSPAMLVAVEPGVGPRGPTTPPGLPQHINHQTWVSPLHRPLLCTRCIQIDWPHWKRNVVRGVMCAVVTTLRPQVSVRAVEVVFSGAAPQLFVSTAGAVTVEVTPTAVIATAAAAAVTVAMVASAAAVASTWIKAVRCPVVFKL